MNEQSPYFPLLSWREDFGKAKFRPGKIWKAVAFLTYILLTNVVNAQTIIFGKVIDEDTELGVPYANVQISNTAFGTACNDQGDFTIAILPEYFDDSLKVSCIGYSNVKIPITDLMGDFNVNHRIYVNPVTQFLDEVKVTAIRERPEEFLKKAIDAIPKNYYQEPFNMELYSRMVEDTLDSIPFQIESILLTHREGYLPESRTYIKFLNKRARGTIPTTLQPKELKEYYFPYTPSFDIAVMDQIGGPMGNSVFNPKNFKKYKFRYSGVSIFDQDTLISIEYGDKKKNSRYHSTVFISSGSLAIVKHTHRFGKAGDYKAEIIYKKVNAYYFPYSIKTDIPVFWSTAYFILDEIIVKNIMTENIVPIEKTYYQGYPKGVPYDEEYWNANYPIKEADSKSN